MTCFGPDEQIWQDWIGLRDIQENDKRYNDRLAELHPI
jgi:hypothetical protein